MRNYWQLRKIIKIKHNENFFKKVVNFIIIIFKPLIPAIIVAGLLTGISNIALSEISFANHKSFGTITHTEEFWKFLKLPGNAIFLYIPSYVCYRIIVINHHSGLLGMIIGFLLITQPLKFIDISSDITNNIPEYFKFEPGKFFFSFKNFFDPKFSWQIIPNIYFPPKIQYSGQILVGFTVGIFANKIANFYKRKIHYSDAIHKEIIFYFLTILSIFLITMFFIGPLFLIISLIIIKLVVFTFAKIPLNYFIIFLLGLLYSPFVIIGFHHILLPLTLQIQNYYGADFIPVVASLDAVAQGTSCLVYYYFVIQQIKTRQKMKKKLFLATLLATIGGVTEPAMYQFTLRKPKLFICACIGTALGSLIVAITGVTSITGIESLLGIISLRAANHDYVDRSLSLFGGLYFWFIIALLITIIITFTTAAISNKFFKKENLWSLKIKKKKI